MKRTQFRIYLNKEIIKVLPKHTETSESGREVSLQHGCREILQKGELAFGTLVHEEYSTAGCADLF